MAEENKELESEVSEAEPARSTKKNNWIMIVVILLILVGGGYAAWKFALAKKFQGKDNPKTEEGEQDTAEVKDEEFGSILAMEPFIVNLQGGEGKRYLKITVEIEVEDDEIKNELTQRTPQLRDSILLLLTSKSFENISKPEGKLRLKNELIARITQIFPQGGIRTLYFTEFVVQ